METAATFSWVVPVTVALVVLGFAAFALWFVLRLDRSRHND